MFNSSLYNSTTLAHSAGKKWNFKWRGVEWLNCGGVSLKKKNDFTVVFHHLRLSLLRNTNETWVCPWNNTGMVLKVCGGNHHLGKLQVSPWISKFHFERNLKEKITIWGFLKSQDTCGDPEPTFSRHFVWQPSKLSLLRGFRLRFPPLELFSLSHIRKILSPKFYNEKKKTCFLLLRNKNPHKNIVKMILLKRVC